MTNQEKIVPTYRSIQELLLEKWNTYRVVLEDNSIYTIQPGNFVKPNQSRIDIIYHALSRPESIKTCNDILTDMLYVLRLLLQRIEFTLHEEAHLFPSHMTPMEIAAHVNKVATSRSQSAAMSPAPRPTSGDSHGSIQSLTSTTSRMPDPANPNQAPVTFELAQGGPPTPQIVRLPSKNARNTNSAQPKFAINLPKLDVSDPFNPPHEPQIVEQLPETYDILMGDIISERMQHDLISLTVSIFSGLLHHSDLIPKLPFAGSYGAETDKRILVSLLFDIMFLLWHFFDLVALNKRRFVLMVNELINHNIIYAAIYCSTNIITQVISSQALSFLFNLIRSDDKMTMLLIQSYDLLSILYLRLKLMVNIDLLRVIQANYNNPPLANSSELALRLKPLQEPLRHYHLSPFLILLQFYHQMFTTISNTYSKRYVDDEFIFELESQCAFLIRYLQLLATQVHQLVIDPQLYSNPPTGLTIVANRSLYIQENPLYVTPSLVPPKEENNPFEKAQQAAQTHLSSHLGSIPSTSVVVEKARHRRNASSAFSNLNPSKSALPNSMTQEMTLQSHTSAINSTVGTRYVIDTGKKNNNKGEVSGPLSAHQGLAAISGPVTPIILGPKNTNIVKFTKDTMIAMRPILQLSVFLLKLMSQLTVDCDLPDIFLYRDPGIISTSIKLGVDYRLDMPLTSFSPGLFKVSEGVQRVEWDIQNGNGNGSGSSGSANGSANAMKASPQVNGGVQSAPQVQIVSSSTIGVQQQQQTQQRNGRGDVVIDIAPQSSQTKSTTNPNQTQTQIPQSQAQAQTQKTMQTQSSKPLTQPESRPHSSSIPIHLDHLPSTSPELKPMGSKK